MGGPWERKQPASERFLSKVKKTNSCWIWKASVNGANNYGAFWDGKRIVRAHRFSFELFNGKIKKNKIIMHSCDNPKCVNPDHLIEGTQGENLNDMSAKGRKLKNVKICPSGHDVSRDASVYINKKRGTRSCLICRANQRKIYYKKKGIFMAKKKAMAKAKPKPAPKKK